MTPRAYYNEHDPFAAAWLRQLIATGQIAPGDVDERSVEDVTPADVAPYTQCHFFAGIGGWSLALRLAGWPDDRPVWTGSCPCQPFSAAGKGAGFADERHLWPAWHWLIAQCRPGLVVGEQVDAALRHGWWDLVATDLEGIDYACWAAGLPAASVGAYHIRQRLWWVAESRQQSAGRGLRGGVTVGTGGTLGELALPLHAQRGAQHVPGQDGRDGADGGRAEAHDAAGARGEVRALAHPDGGDAGDGDLQRGGEYQQRAADGVPRWKDALWIPCRDGKHRPVEPGTFPLAHGLSGRLAVDLSTGETLTPLQAAERDPATVHWYSRVGALRGYGNAIVPQVAAAFLQAYDETLRVVVHEL